ncbi:putative gustatory receptor clone PTE03 [Astyanax mexicanus]|uniref:putative gustatory receptor clone PTE03 n=1 Tax=Astyanax mexicanus TaxID=7994 RepID=UPI0020CB5282|nr:putative gustatory receptor clone PTE03 [Astyanax mexicanus]XP_049331927.1 putative gustatory receptor clone PTE03 [Astyanax mexicanus]
MNYSSNVTYLTLEGHVELEKYRYIYFLLSLTVYLIIIYCNIVVILVIYTNQRLHEPMYIFIAALLCNALSGTAAFYPKLLIDLLSDPPCISFEACTFQAFWLYTYASAEFTLLSAMAYDRYVSICKPLQYATLVNMSTVKTLLIICWVLPACENGITMILTYRLTLCKFKLNRIYCNNYAIVKLSCEDTTANNSYGLFTLVVCIFPPVIFVIYSYIRILDVCLKNSKEFRRKALQTCFPHLFVFISFSVTSCFEVINSRLEAKLPQILAMMLSIENIIIPPLINPVMYGLKLHEISNAIKSMMWNRKTHFVSN